LGGTLPVEIGQLTSLQLLRLGGFVDNQYTMLSGSLPASMGKLVQLTHLEIIWTQLSGELPAELSALRNLNWFSLLGNQLSGTP
jgi:kinesin family protein C2/C3